MDVQRLLEDEERGWKALLDTFARIPDERFEEPTLTPEGWSAKDAMFHIGYWLDDSARVLDAIREGTFDAAEEHTLDIQSMNDAGFLRSRDMEPSTARAGFIQARARARTAAFTLEVFTPEAWEWIEESGPLHYRKHIDDLDGWLRA